MNNVLLFFSILSVMAISSCASPDNNNSTNNNDVITTLMTRRSVRAYKDQPVNRDTMDVITKCGVFAPNGMNRQNWEIRIVDNPVFIKGTTDLFVEQMSKDERGKKMVSDPSFKNIYRNAPTVVFIATSNGESLIDCGLLAGNMVNAAWSMGIGSCCLGGPIGFLNSEVAAPFLEILDFPADFKLVLAIGFGYPDEKPEAKPRDLNKIRWIE